jgi:hypothetical protein
MVLQGIPTESGPMKPHVNKTKNVIIGGLGALTLLGLSGCATNGDPFSGLTRILSFPGYVNREVVQNEYLYYPEYDLYYNRNSQQFLSVENNRWVTRNHPRNVSAERVFASRSVRIDGYSTPEQHRNAYYEQNRYRSSSRPSPVSSRGWNSARVENR